MKPSLNEVDALVRKASRSVGLPWGLADEAAWAASWLSQFDVQGLIIMTNALDALANAPLSKVLPQTKQGDGEWTSRGEWLCPICTGASLADSAILLRAEPISTSAVRNPLILAPFAAAASRQLDTPVTLEWPDIAIETDGDRMALLGNADMIAAGDIFDAKCSIGGVLADDTLLAKNTRVPIRLATWRRLTDLAAQTHAPSSAEQGPPNADSSQAEQD
ncbi:DUF3726 domain-containing protein [Actibacterium sp. 188UL27-1]|uniref:DUF3726 domain-containing protein n=1 Tax=Actibacterium sp. 188UL27-1 TaxID=2786961 RepID=UPI00195ECC02|nr:DUF3726 domain-containing protein [Actibacterium sp. 188UL27-1]